MKRNGEEFMVTLLRHQNIKTRDETCKIAKARCAVKIFRSFTDTFREYRGTNFGNARRTFVNISKRAILYGCGRFTRGVIYSRE